MSEPVEAIVHPNGIPLPDAILEQAGLQPGDRVRVQVNEAGELVLSRVAGTDEVLAAAEQFMDPFDDAMQRLAQ